MKNKIYVVILVVSIGISCIYADIAQFKTVITKIENMLDGIVPLDRARAEEDLQLLERTTERPSNAADRVARARARLNALAPVRSAQPYQAPAQHIPQPRLPKKPAKKVRFNDTHEVIPVPAQENVSAEKRLESLLLYAQGLVSTADVAAKVHEKNNAQSHIAQARNAVATMRDIMAQNPHLAADFVERIQSIEDRVGLVAQAVQAMI